MVTTDDEDVLALLARVPRPPEAPPVTGATPADLALLAEQLGIPLPPSLSSWLRHCNGAIAGPGVLLGAAASRPTLDIATEQHLWPAWRATAWIPVATDGSGNAWVMAPDVDEHAIFFVDASEDPAQLSYVAASGLDRFLRMLLERELDIGAWLFDREHVVARDPDILCVRGAPLPWAD